MSGAPLDMSLDDLIKQNKKPAGTSSRGRGRSGGPGPARRFPNRTDTRPAPYPTKVAESNWQHDMFGADAYSGCPPVGGAGSIETGTKLYVSNLDYGVSNQDVKELFSEVGDLKRCAVHYDRSGRSKGTAEVVFSRRQDAVAAVKRYNNVQLDGKPMKVDIVGTNISTPAAAGPGPVIGSFGDGDANGIVQRSGFGRGGGRFGRPRGGGGGGGGRGQGFGRGGGRGFGRGGGRGRGRGRDEKVSAEDLDADLEKYHSAAMET